MLRSGWTIVTQTLEGPNDQDNVFYLIQRSDYGLKRCIFGMGCSCHIVHNSYENATAKLPITIETMFFYHRNYTVRTEELKKTCLELDIEYQELSLHTKTRFLTLERSLAGVIQDFDALKSVFSRAPDPLHLVVEFFKNPDALFWLHFLKDQMRMSKEYILKMETKIDNSFTV